MNLQNSPKLESSDWSEDVDSEINDSTRCNTTSISTIRSDFLISHLKRMILSVETNTIDINHQAVLLLNALRLPIIDKELLPTITFKNICGSLSNFNKHVISLLPADVSIWLSSLPIGNQKNYAFPYPISQDSFYVEVLDSIKTSCEERLIRNLLYDIVKQDDLIVISSTLFDSGKICGCIATEAIMSAFISSSLFLQALNLASTFTDSFLQALNLASTFTDSLHPLISVFSFECGLEIIYKLGRSAQDSTSIRTSSLILIKRLSNALVMACSEIQVAQVVAMVLNIVVSNSMIDETIKYSTNNNIQINCINALELDICAALNCLDSDKVSVISTSFVFLITSLVSTLELFKQGLFPLSLRRMHNSSIKISGKLIQESSLQSIITNHFQITSVSSIFLRKFQSSLKKYTAQQHFQNMTCTMYSTLLKDMLYKSIDQMNNESTPISHIAMLEERPLRALINNKRHWTLLSARASYVLSLLAECLNQKITYLISCLVLLQSCPLRPFLVTDDKGDQINNQMTMITTHLGYASLMQLGMYLEKQKSSSIVSVLAIEAACRIICVRDDRLFIYSAAAGGLNAQVPLGLVNKHFHFCAKAFQIQRKLSLAFVQCSLLKRAIFYHERVLSSSLRMGRMREALYIIDALCSLLVDAGDYKKAELFLRSLLRNAKMHISALERIIMFKDRNKTGIIRQSDQVSNLSLDDTVVKRLQNTTYIGKIVSCLTRNFDPEKKSNQKQTSIIQGWVVWGNDSSHIQKHYERDEHDNRDRHNQATRLSEFSIPIDTLPSTTLRSFLAVGTPLALTITSESYQMSEALLTSWLDREETSVMAIEKSTLCESLLALLPVIPHGANFDAHKTKSTKAEISSNRLTWVDLRALETRLGVISLRIGRDTTAADSLNRLKKSIVRNDPLTSVDAILLVAKASYANNELSDTLVAINQCLPFLPIVMTKLESTGKGDRKEPHEIEVVARAIDSAFCVCSSGSLVWIRNTVATDLLLSLGPSRMLEKRFKISDSFLVTLQLNDQAFQLIILHIKVNLAAFRPVEALRSTDLLLRAFTTLVRYSNSTLYEPIRNLRHLRGRALQMIATFPSLARLPYQHPHQHTATTASASGGSTVIQDHLHGHTNSDPRNQNALVNFKSINEVSKASVSSFSAAFRLCTVSSGKSSTRRGSLEAMSTKNGIRNEYLALKSALRVAETLLDKRYGRGEKEKEEDNEMHHKDIEIPVMMSLNTATRLNNPFCLLRSLILFGELRALQSGLEATNIGKSRTWLNSSTIPLLSETKLQESALQAAKDASELLCRLFSNSQGLCWFMQSRKVSAQLKKRIEKIVNRLALLFLVLGSDASDENWFVFNLLIDAQNNVKSPYRLASPKALVSSVGERSEIEPEIYCHEDSRPIQSIPLWVKELTLKTSQPRAERLVLPMLSPPRLESSDNSNSPRNSPHNSPHNSPRNSLVDMLQIEHAVSFATSSAGSDDDDEDHNREWKDVARLGIHKQGNGYIDFLPDNLADSVDKHNENDKEEGMEIREEDCVDLILGQLALIKDSCMKVLSIGEDTVSEICVRACKKIQSATVQARSTSSKSIIFNPSVSFSQLLASATVHEPCTANRLVGLVLVLSLSHEIDVLYSPGYHIAQIINGPLTTNLSDRQFFAKVVDIPMREDNVNQRHQLEGVGTLDQAVNSFAESLHSNTLRTQIYLTISAKLILWPFEKNALFSSAIRLAVGNCIVDSSKQKPSSSISIIIPSSNETTDMDLIRRRSMLSSHLREFDSTLRRPPYPSGSAISSPLIKNLLLGSGGKLVSLEGFSLIAKLCERNTDEDMLATLASMNGKKSFIIPDEWSVRSHLTNAFVARPALGLSEQDKQSLVQIQYLSTRRILSLSDDPLQEKILILSFADTTNIISKKVPYSFSSIIFVSNSALSLAIQYMNDEVSKNTKSAQKASHAVVLRLRQEGHFAVIQFSS